MRGGIFSPYAIPKDWTVRVRTALLHVIALAQYAAVYTRAWAANSSNARVRLQADKNQLQQEVAWLKEELRIKDARWVGLAPWLRVEGCG